MSKMTLNRVFTALALTGLMVGAMPAQAHQAGDFLVRAGAINVSPNEDSSKVLGIGEFDVEDDWQLGLNFTYMATDNIGIELLASTPFEHDISVDNLGEIGDTKQLPPTLMLQYYFGDSQSTWRPYVGAGINLTNFFDSDLNSHGKDAGLSNLSLDNSVGWAVHAGVDYMINDKWFVNAQVWYADIETDAEFYAGGEKQRYSIDIDPVVYMVGVGYTF